MKDVDLATLTAPLSGAEPCGPDLELADDDDYLNAVVTTETILPPEYYVFSDYIGARQPYDQDRRYADLDIAGRIAAVVPFIDITRDLRLYVLLTKLYVLARSLPNAVTCVEAIAVLLEERWAGVHPNGDDEMRSEVLQRLDDPLIVTAFPHVPLFMSKRFGAITWQRYLTEVRKSGGTGDEPEDFDRSLADEGQTDLSVMVPLRNELAQTRATLERLALALRRMRAACAEHMSSGPPTLPALSQVLEKLHRFIDRIYRLAEATVVQLDPTAGLEPVAELASAEPTANGADQQAGSNSSGRPTTALKNVEEAAGALAAVVGYFERSEPSNPALLLLRQAQDLIGKSFVEAMQILVPDHAEKAMFEVGSAKIFSLPLSRLAASAPGPVADDAVDGHVETRAPAATRGEAVVLLEQVGAYFRVAEPSSPIPMLTDGARTLTGKDFMTLLGDVLPKDTLKAPGGR